MDSLPVNVVGAALSLIVVVLWTFGRASAQYLAALFGAAGALLLAIPGVHPAWGFAAFLVSNLGWLHFAKQRSHWGLVAQQLVFLLTSLVGVWNWWLGPLLLG